MQDDPLWSARLLHTNPSAIHQVHESYLNHGADIIITASYQVLLEIFLMEYFYVPLVPPPPL